MVQRKTIKLPVEQYEKHNERRQAMGLSWAEYVDGQAPEWGDPVDHDALATAVADKVGARLR